MTKIKVVDFCKWLLKAGCAGVISLAILSLFTFVYGYTGVHITNPTGATDYHWKSNQFRSTMSEGFSWFYMDENGFNNEKIVDNIDILLMGSSHMEAVNVVKSQNTVSVLKSLLPDKSIYNIGISGHTLYRCVSNLEDAVKYYNPRDVVIIETDSVVLDVEQMEQVMNKELTRIPSHDSGLLYKIQVMVPAVLPIYRQISNWRAAGNSVDVDEEKDVNLAALNDLTSDDYQECLERFLQFAVEKSGGRKIIIFFHPSTSIAKDGTLIMDNKGAEDFSIACKDVGITFVDMADDFRRTYEENHKLPHGFSNTSVGIGHLNQVGHSLAAERLAKVIGGSDGIK